MNKDNYIILFKNQRATAAKLADHLLPDSGVGESILRSKRIIVIFVGKYAYGGKFSWQDFDTEFAAEAYCFIKKGARPIIYKETA